MRALYAQYLPAFGLRCTYVSLSSEAIEAITDAQFRGEKFDGVILGKTMAKPSGSLLDIAAYIHKALPELPIILVSDLDFSEIEYRAGRAGIEHFIPIPVFRKSLADGLSRALEHGEGGDSASGTPDLSGRCILLAEDNAINAEIAGEILGMTGA